jgi:hypothetical protein
MSSSAGSETSKAASSATALGLLAAITDWQFMAIKEIASFFIMFPQGRCGIIIISTMEQEYYS